jgi:hypothetical protein
MLCYAIEAAVTLIFAPMGAGVFVGPVLVGALERRTGSYDAGLYFSTACIVLAFGAVAALGSRRAPVCGSVPAAPEAARGASKAASAGKNGVSPPLSLPAAASAPRHAHGRERRWWRLPSSRP